MKFKATEDIDAPLELVFERFCDFTQIEADLTGRGAEAEAVRLDSLGWARYGFGADWAVRAKLREVAALNPLKGRS